MSGVGRRGGGSQFANYNFTNWNYGYTLGPPNPGTNVDYPSFYQQNYGGGGYPYPPAAAATAAALPIGVSGRGGGAAAGRGSKPLQKKAESSVTAAAAVVEAKSTSTSDPVKAAAGNDDKSKSEQSNNEDKGMSNKNGSGNGNEEGEIVERPLSEILQGRNPIMFCNDQSKFRGLHMEWEQISETGPPHDKTFTWSLKMGDMTAIGSANSKKGAKAQAAEEMAKKLDQLPKVPKRSYQQAWGRGGRGRGGRGGGRGIPYGGYGPPPPPGWFMGYGPMGPPPPGIPPVPPPSMPGHMMFKKRKVAAVATGAAGTAPEQEAQKKEQIKLINTSQNNPISKLYEFCKKRKHPEPIFTTVSENVLESRRTLKGFTVKKTEFTIRCEVIGKKFVGTAMTKKQAKTNAAAAAWAEIGVGVDQSSIDSLLHTQRSNAAAGITSPIGATAVTVAGATAAAVPTVTK